MTDIAIITGDIVDSTHMTAEERTSMLHLLRSLPHLLAPLTKTEMEIFRGDSFQIKVTEVCKALRVALAVRALIRTNRFAKHHGQWDARLSIGIGTHDFETDSISTSDGEAYRLSGRALDTIGKSRLSIETPWKAVNKELKVSTAFADNIVTGWTRSQSRIVFEKLAGNIKQAEIGVKLGISNQMVSKALKTAKESLIQLYLDRFEELIHENTIWEHQ